MAIGADAPTIADTPHFLGCSDRKDGGPVPRGREFLLSRLVVERRRKMAHVAVCSERTRMAVARREVAEVAVPAAKGRGGIYGSGK